ncbi:NAD(P)-binding protein [Viridothelium virens]|uniref:NAD(P)-binding protein n=1 Tax=Viridothelium virens TaxID=1048519 RepID=A0A6A6HJ06_VIRVR|nr:NAD(P)-binding protein [Viridothelium virens]
MSDPSACRFPTLSGKVAIVTGSSRGLGVAMALELAKRGAKVAITYTSDKSTEAAEGVVASIKALKNGSDAIQIQADLRLLESPKKIVSETTSAFGGAIDILVNNAGVEVQGSLADLTPEMFASTFDVNVRAVLFLCQAVQPHLRKPGRIINISSVGGRSGFLGFTLYGASKGALEQMTRNLAAELGPAGHTVNAVAPGPTASDMLDGIPKDLVEMQKKATPLENRLGTAEDIALIVAWLAEEQARWVTGQTISASGGLSMY